MRIEYKNVRLENVLKGLKALTSAVVIASFVILFGFEKPLLPVRILYTVQIAMLFVFLSGKVIRLINAVSIKEYLYANWFEFPLLFGLGIVVLGSDTLFERFEPGAVRHFAVGIYLVIEVVIKICVTSVNMASTGRNPTRMLITSFLVLIFSGTGLLMLPRSSAGENLGFVDAFFTATSATCVTGLIVKDTGGDFTLMGQIIILALIQLGGLGIIVFGAVLALLLGQALSIRGSVAMQDLLSARTLGRIGNMIVFIFVGTVFIEAIGALVTFDMWDNVPNRIDSVQQQWFCSIFHSISAFCNAGFCLFSDSLRSYRQFRPVYTTICPLIILGGLGFGVLYDIACLVVDRLKRLAKQLSSKEYRFSMETPKRMQLQSKIVLTITVLLILAGMLGVMFFESYATGSELGGNPDTGIFDAFFQSVTARTAGFNTVDISKLSASSRFVLILLMFVGGSPGSTAGGIKTVTLAVIIMTVIAALRKREEVEMFRRSVRIVVVGRAITVTLLFVVVLFGASLALSVTESGNGFTMSQIIFESGSALGTVGLTTGITPSLTDAGKLIIILVMLVGRLGPLTLLAALTFNLRPARYNYPDEAVIVG